MGKKILLSFSIIILSFVFFGGFVLNQSLQNGIGNMEKRLGADLMIVPADSEEAAEDILIEGSRNYFYLDSSVYDIAKTAEGVREATPQFYFKSLAADCCSSEVEIVFFEPDSDFLIQPWFDKVYNSRLEKGTAVIGNDVGDEEGIIRLFGKEYPVAGKLARTGTSIDKSVYFSFDTVPVIMDDAKKAEAYIPDTVDYDRAVSSVFLNITDGYDIEEVIKEIRGQVKENIGIVYPKKLADSFSSGLSEIYTVINCVVIAVLLVSFAMMCIVNMMSAYDRKRELALLRILGASRKRLTGILIKETAIISAYSGMTGCFLSGLIVIPFGNYIGYKLDMPYPGPDIPGVICMAVIVLAVSLVTGILSSIYPAIRISRMEPYNAIRKEGE